MVSEFVSSAYSSVSLWCKKMHGEFMDEIWATKTDISSNRMHLFWMLKLYRHAGERYIHFWALSFFLLFVFGLQVCFQCQTFRWHTISFTCLCWGVVSTDQRPRIKAASRLCGASSVFKALLTSRFEERRLGEVWGLQDWDLWIWMGSFLKGVSKWYGCQPSSKWGKIGSDQSSTIR